jgi:hypothetical protein
MSAQYAALGVQLLAAFLKWRAERKAAPLWFWITAALLSAAVAFYYAVLTFTRLEVFKMLLSSFFPLAFMILAVLGTIVFGLATPTEAAAVGSLGGVLPAGGDPFAVVMPLVLAAPDDCGGLAALPFMDDEPGLGISRGGSACLVGLGPANATPGNAVKAMLLATMFNLRMGSEELDAQGFPRTEIILSGGLTKTPALGQLLADALHAPVVILDGATEGTAWGAALAAKYRDQSLAGKAADWPAFLEAHESGAPVRFTPRPAAAAILDRAYARHRRLVGLHEALL